MKNKTIIIVLFLILSVLLSLVLYNTYIKRKPEKIVKEVLGFEIINSNYKIKVFEEQWYENGDGYCLIIFDNICIEDIITRNELNKLPLSIKLPPTEITSKLKDFTKGLYWVKINTSDSRNVYLFLYDEIKKRAIFYYQIL